MRFDVISLFPELVQAIASCGVVGRALRERLAQLHTWQMRDWAEPPHFRVDARPYGGGPGMVLRADVLHRALQAVRAEDASAPAHVIAMGASGQRLDQSRVRQLTRHPRLIIVAGRYAGLDERFIAAEVDLELSVGDYILSGGELPAMSLIDALVRQIPGALGNAGSLDDDGFGPDGALDYPRYTRPPEFAGQPVPEVLLRGNHAEIRRWREAQARERTRRRAACDDE
ncbi:MAG: tRNA (guanosine(37)-N1)-methyltransferase TrmD [Gammaproteobacteria bacterium AqS3]|nr:tRNA (guanosine(37)-N1)-methyltransferase TrmD [Gammaproteobacteria bacterium AqS3]